MDSVELDGFFATFSVMPSGAVSSEGRTGILSVVLDELLWRITIMIFLGGLNKVYEKDVSRLRNVRKLPPRIAARSLAAWQNGRPFMFSLTKSRRSRIIIVNSLLSITFIFKHHYLALYFHLKRLLRRIEVRHPRAFVIVKKPSTFDQAAKLPAS